MKVAANTFAASAQTSSQRAETNARTGQSFAALLATGRTISSIRDERALGFSETGLIGAPRSAKDERTARSDRAMKGPDQGISTRRESSTRPAVHFVDGQEEHVSTSVHDRGRLSSLNRSSEMPGIRSHQFHEPPNAAPFTIWSQESFEYNAQWSGQIRPWVRRLRALRVRRGVNVSGTGEIVDVNAFDAGLDKDQYDAVIENFLATALHFSVTLGTVKLNGKNVTFHRSQESERS